eukprot:jgi/Botrbrau1/2621/Bobra.145_1s0039.1
MLLAEDFDHESLRGQLNVGLALEVLDLGHNNISGPLPEDLWRLSYLRAFIMKENRLSGTLPAIRGTDRWPTSLQHIQLDHNFINGTVPRELLLSHNLRLVSLSNNQFNSMPWPERKGLSESPRFLDVSFSLRYVDVSFNRITVRTHYRDRTSFCF